MNAPQVGNRIICTIRLYIAGKHPAAISIRVCRWPATVMIAFGGVATGILNAYEHMRVTGIIRYNGCILIATHFEYKYKILFVHKIIRVNKYYKNQNVKYSFVLYYDFYLLLMHKLDLLLKYLNYY